MAEAPVWPVSTGDYLADTQHLTTEEHGAYLLLLMTQWRNNGEPLPDDDDRLARIVRASKRKWMKNLRPVLADFFDISDAGWLNKRVAENFNSVAERRKKMRDNGAQGGRAKALKNNDPDLAKATDQPDDCQPSEKPNDLPSLNTKHLTPREEVRSQSASPPEPELDRPKQDPPPDGGGDDAGRIVSRFLELRAECWPTESSFPAPTMTLATIAGQWLAEPNADVELLLELVERGMRAAAAEGKPSIGTLKFFDRSVRSALISHGKAKTPSDPLAIPDFLDRRTKRLAPEDATDDDWRTRVEMWRENPGSWAEHWGPEPGETGCLVPAHILREFDLTFGPEAASA